MGQEQDLRDGVISRFEVSIPDKGVSLFLARSGVGKSAVLINLALAAMLRGRRILHFSVKMSSERVHQYYQSVFDEVYGRLSDHVPKESWSPLNSQVTVFSYPDESRLFADLESQIESMSHFMDLKKTRVMVDGISSQDLSKPIQALRQVVQEKHISILGSATVHRGEGGQVDLEAALEAARPLMGTVVFLEPDGRMVQLKTLTPETREWTASGVWLDPHDLVLNWS